MRCTVTNHIMDSFRTLLLIFALFSIGLHASAINVDDGRQAYIVYMGHQSLSSELSQSDGSSTAESVHHDLLNQVLDGSSAPDSIIYSYKRSINGFAARLTEQEKQKLASMEGIVSIFPSKTHKPLTTRSWDFLGLSQTVQRSLPLEGDVIVGMLDTGVWPHTESFSDEGFSAPPSRWKGVCQNFTCNNKIIGARYYHGLEGAGLSPLDTAGHGSHTASIVAGRVVGNISLDGMAAGSVRGAVPSARLAIYKVCWEDGCTEHDILAAFDDAIADGVDIISYSIGNRFAVEYFEDAGAIGAFHAMKNGVLTSTAAGNSGPKFGHVCNVAPWLLSVGASSIDRRMIAKLVLGNGKTIVGATINLFPTRKNSPLVVPKNGSCDPESLAGSSYKGKILLCATPDSNVTGPFLAGAEGAVIVGRFHDAAFPLPLPALIVTQAQFSEILDYINSTSDPVGTIDRTETTFDPEAPTLISFSSRGPNTITPGILKPDLSAPGVGILAAWSPLGSLSFDPNDKRKVQYNIVSGTSMACPHASGVAAYVKSFHPDWSPAMVMSAMITTASIDPSHNPGGELSYGAGQVNPTRARNPGLVYDASESDYIGMLCAQGYNSSQLGLITGSNSTGCPYGSGGSVSDLNYPTMALHVTPGEHFHAVFPRTVTNVGVPRSVYVAIIVNSASNLAVSIAPRKLVFNRLYQKMSFTVTVSGKIPAANESVSASIVWSDGEHDVRSPVVAYTVDVQAG